jgi:hypothetical protein
MTKEINLIQRLQLMERMPGVDFLLHFGAVIHPAMTVAMNHSTSLL